MVALRARRLVCSAMSEMSSITEPMRSAACARPAIVSDVVRAPITALSATVSDEAACRPISPIEA